MADGRILVTGPTGFVGRALVERLRQAGQPLTLALRAAVPDSRGSVRLVSVGDVCGTTDWYDALQGVDRVVHLAAHVHVAPERAVAEARRFDEVNHLGSARLYEAASRFGVRRFVFVSSIMALGGSTLPGYPFTDRTEAKPETPYGRSKRDAERALRALASTGGSDLVILRPPLICGPGVGANLEMLARLARLPVPLPLGGLQNRRTLLSLENLIGAIEAALLPGAPTGTFGLGDATTVSTSDIVRELAAGFGRRAILLPAPIGLLTRAARLAKREGYAQRLFGDLQIDSTGFRRAFGWHDRVDTATSLRATAAAMVAPSW